MEHNNVKIGIGLGNIIFGMTQNDVINILGNPDSKEEHNYPNNEIRWLLKYEERGIELSFDSDENDRLGSIDIESSEYLIENESSVIGLSLNEILGILERRSFSVPTIESISNEFVQNHLILYYDKEGISLSLINYMCNSFEFSPLWKSENEVIWPFFEQE